MVGIILKKPQTLHEWNAYHQIKEQEIFIPIHVAYEKNHPCFSDPHHEHFIALKENVIFGILHVHFLQPATYAIRGIAVIRSMQHQGLGSQLLAEANRYLKERHAETVFVHAAPGAVDFYARQGYVRATFPGDISINSETVDMVKLFAHKDAK